MSTVTVSAPVTPASIAAATPAADTVPTVAAFRSALAAATTKGTASATATATLAAITLARYNVHAAKYVRTLDGTRVLLASSKAEVSKRVWQDAGHAKAPAADKRTSGETSLGQYLSKFGTVATDELSGVDYLTDTETAFGAYDALAAARAEDKKADADRAFTVWMSGLLAEDHAALARVIGMFDTDKGDAPAHRAAFVRAITPLKSAK